MNRKNIILVFTVTVVLLLYWSSELLRENRAFKDKLQGWNRQSVEATIDRLEPFYDKQLTYWESRLQEKSGEDLLAKNIADLRESKSFFTSLYRSDISLLSTQLDSAIYLLEELKEQQTLTEIQKEELHEAVIMTRTIAGQLITYAGESKNGWYAEFTEEESKSAKYVRKLLKASD